MILPDIRINLFDGAIPAWNEILTMDLNGIIDFLHSGARSVGAEVTSPWFYLQCGLILAAAGIALAVDAGLRARAVQ